MSALPAYDFSSMPGSHLRIVHRRGESPLDAINRLERRFNQMQVNVIGDASHEVKENVRNQYKAATIGNQELMLSGYGVRPVKDKDVHDVYLISEKPGPKGIMKAYTDFKNVYVNKYGVPGTSEYDDYTLSEWLPMLRGQYGNIMRKTLGTPYAANKDLNETIFHEKVHEEGEGMELYMDIIEEVTNYIMDALGVPDGLRERYRVPIAHFYAMPHATRIIEGITETITMERETGKSAREIHTETTDPVTVYEDYTNKESGIIGNGFDMFSGYQAIGAAKENPGFLRSYVRSSMRANGFGP